MLMHAISTGKVKVTQNWQVGHGTGALRLINTLLDSRFTDWLPIYCWVIEHPEGLIVVDTGIPANANAPIWYPPHMRLLQRAAPFLIASQQEEIGPQLKRLGFSPDDVRWLVLTHLHQDHDGGMHYFRNAEIMISRTEWKVASGFKGRMGGYQNQRWSWLTPTLIDFAPDPEGIFGGRFTLTQRGDVHLVPTPGHSAGHLSLIVDEGTHQVIFAGDTSYTQELLLARTLDGVAIDAAAELDSQERILKLAQAVPTVYLPSHDPDAERRLAQRDPVPVITLMQQSA